MKKSFFVKTYHVLKWFFIGVIGYIGVVGIILVLFPKVRAYAIVKYAYGGYKLVLYQLETIVKVLGLYDYYRDIFPDNTFLDVRVPDALVSLGHSCYARRLVEKRVQYCHPYMNDTADYYCMKLQDALPRVRKACQVDTLFVPGRSEVIRRLLTPSKKVYEIIQGEHIPSASPLSEEERDAIEKRYPHSMVVYSARANGKTLVVLESWVLDPSGEVPNWGLWVLFSHRGRNFEGPYHTGLRLNYPFSLARDRVVLPYKDGYWYIPVRYNLLREESICFPPVCVSFVKIGKYEVLAFSERLLTMDSDEDGLTDLIEDRLVTDPHHPDTDRDGIIDSIDTNPLVPFSMNPTQEARAYSAALAYRWEVRKLKMYVTLRRQNASLYDELKRNTSEKGFKWGKVSFIVAYPGALEGIEQKNHVVVLYPFEKRLYEQKFGVSFFMTLSPVIWHPSQKKAIIQVDERWKEYTVEVEDRGNVWFLRILSAWIT